MTDETDVDVSIRDEGTKFETAMVEAAGWTVFVSEEDGGLHINIPDHATVHVTGEPKDDPLVTLESDEFPTLLEVIDSLGSFRRLTDIGENDRNREGEDVNKDDDTERDGNYRESEGRDR